MLIVIPLMTFLAVFLWISGRDEFPDYGLARWGRAFLASAVVWGFALILMSELLSLVNGINRIGLSLGWLLLLMIVFIPGWRKGTLQSGWKRFRNSLKIDDKFDIFMLVAVSLILLALFLVAVISPPNNVDSLKYHMARVMHWAENENIQPFATANSKEVFNPIWAEAAILHLRVLWGNDRPANLVQWFSMLGSLVGAAGIAGMLGANRRGRWLAVAFAISVPIAILQASSTQTDYVVAFWAIALMFFTVLSKRAKFETVDVFFLGGALGLGMLTKGTFYLYAFPILLWFFIPRLFKVRLPRFAGQAAIVLVVAVIINLGYWTRNIHVFHAPFGFPGRGFAGIEIRLIELVTGREITELVPTDLEVPEGAVVLPTPVPTAVPTPAAEQPESPQKVQQEQPGYVLVLRRLPNPVRVRAIWALKMLGQNAMGPEISGPLLGLMRNYPGIFDVVYLSNLEEGAWNHEDTAGNPIHLLMVPITLLFIPFMSGREFRRIDLLYALTALLSYGLLAMIAGSTHAFAVRYQLPFFILWAPLVGSVFSATGKNWVAMAMSIFFLIIALPYVFINNAKPLIGMTPNRTRVGSIFTEPQPNLMFESITHIQDEYYDVRGEILDSGCQDVGLVIDSTHLEYLFWWMLDAPQSGIRVESLNPSLELGAYMEDDFEACAIVCTICPGVEELGGLPVEMDFGYLQLYLAER